MNVSSTTPTESSEITQTTPIKRAISPLKIVVSPQKNSVEKAKKSSKKKNTPTEKNHLKIKNSDNTPVSSHTSKENGDNTEHLKVPKIKLNIANLNSKVNGVVSVISDTPVKTEPTPPRKSNRPRKKKKIASPYSSFSKSNESYTDLNSSLNLSQTKKKATPKKKKVLAKKRPVKRSHSQSNSDESPVKKKSPVNNFVPKPPVISPKRYFRPDIPLSKLRRTPQTAAAPLLQIKKKPKISEESITSDDETWLCSFCHQVSHFENLGDLFGPYYKDQANPQCNGEEMNDSLPNIHLHVTAYPSTSKDNKKGQAVVTGKSIRNQGKVKLKYNNINKTIISSTQHSKPQSVNPVEIWVHELCAVWTPGVFIQDGKVRGLGQAVTEAAGNNCSSCHLDGATLFCVARGCTLQYHYPCSVKAKCLYMEDNFSMYCLKHKSKANLPQLNFEM